jgi:hypothetical protein
MFKLKIVTLVREIYRFLALNALFYKQLKDNSKEPFLFIL